MLQAIENIHDRQFLATELASPATLVAELAQPEVKNILLAYVIPSPMNVWYEVDHTKTNSKTSSASGSVATIKSASLYHRSVQAEP